MKAKKNHKKNNHSNRPFTRNDSFTMSLFASETRKEIKGSAMFILDLLIREHVFQHMDQCMRDKPKEAYAIMAFNNNKESKVDIDPYSEEVVRAMVQVHQDMGFPPIPTLTMEDVEEQLEPIKEGDWVERCIYAHIKTLLLNAGTADAEHSTPPPPP
jgi:hypothetical protein